MSKKLSWNFINFNFSSHHLFSWLLVFGTWSFPEYFEKLDHWPVKFYRVPTGQSTKCGGGGYSCEVISYLEKWWHITDVFKTWVLLYAKIWRVDEKRRCYTELFYDACFVHQKLLRILFVEIFGFFYTLVFFSLLFAFGLPVQQYFSSSPRTVSASLIYTL